MTRFALLFLAVGAMVLLTSSETQAQCYGGGHYGGHYGGGHYGGNYGGHINRGYGSGISINYGHYRPTYGHYGHGHGYRNYPVRSYGHYQRGHNHYGHGHGGHIRYRSGHHGGSGWSFGIRF